VNEASKTLRNIRSVSIKEFTAAVEDKKVTSYRVNAKVAFEIPGEANPLSGLKTLPGVSQNGASGRSTT